LREGDPLPGINERAIFIVTKEGKIAFAKTYELGEEPNYEEVVSELEKLNASSAVSR
jgi:peroxiredoxin